jgi:glycosyltransferase involved in cell wall biosynthesis
LTTPAPPAPPGDGPLRIFQWAASLEDGTYLYRLRIPGDELRRLGHEVQTSTRIGAWAFEEADVVVGHRLCQPAPVSRWLTLCDELRRRGAVSVYEVDDDLFSIERKTNPLGLPFQHPQVQEAMRLAIRAADVVTVSTEPLAGVLRKVRGPKADPASVRVVPNCIPATVLQVRRTRPVGWTTMYGWQGSSTHERDWLEARDAVTTVLREDVGTRLRFVGAYHLDGLPSAYGKPIGRVDFQGWTVDLDEHHRRVADFDVSLAPLARTPFNTSKSGLRVIESLALGVPVVASDVPAYSGWVEDGVTGFYARSTEQWTAALRKLQDAAVRAEMGAAGRKAAEAWTIEANIDKWINAYRRLPF